MIKHNYLFKNLYLNSPTIVKNIQASLYSYIVSKHKYGQIYNYWSELLKESERWDIKEIKSFQLELLNSFLKHVSQNSPHYVDYINNIDGGSVIDDLEKICKSFPIINKKNVRESYDEILGKNNNRKLFKFSSSGTTGTSLHVFLDVDAYQREYAFRNHFLSTGGAKANSRFAYFLGNKLFKINKTKLN